jgi:hypothetical protein
VERVRDPSSLDCGAGMDVYRASAGTRWRTGRVSKVGDSKAEERASSDTEGLVGKLHRAKPATGNYGGVEHDANQVHHTGAI